MTVQPTRAYRTTVARVARLSPHFTRITVTAEDLRHFGPQGTALTEEEARRSPAAWDQRIKLFLPRPDGGYPELGLFADPPASMMEWYNVWRMLDDAERNPIRTYTVREIRTAAREVDIDFVVHVEADGSSGPAAAWALSAQPGDEAILIGPDRRGATPHGGIEWNPGTAREVLLAGDETAAPAICGILEGLAASELKKEKKSNLAVHAQTGKPCPRCGDVVREVSFADSSLQYCPTCQTGGKKLADRRLSKLLR